MNIANDSAPAVATLSGVSKRYGEVTAVDRLDLTVHRGEVLALLGPNGAGKTTCVSLLLGLARPDSGRAELFGCSPYEQTARRRVGVMLQGAQLGGRARVREIIGLHSGYYLDALPLRETLCTAGLAGLERRPVEKLSGGQRQRLLFALAICGNPQLLFLDEPTVGLDVESRRGFWAAIRQLGRQGRSIVLTTHYLEEADALADRIVVLSRGRLVAAGSPAEIKRSVSRRTIRCVSRLPACEIERLPGVTSVRQDRGRLEVLCSHPESVLRSMLELDPALSGLEVSGARLEEAFVALTTNEQERAA